MIASHNILVSDLLDPRAIILNVDQLNKTLLLKDFSDRMADVYTDVNASRFYEGIMNRENDLSTGIGRNIAIPHAVAKSAQSLHLLFATHKGIEYDALDGKPVRIIFMLAIPPSQKQIYSAFLMKISKLMSTGNLIHELFQVKYSKEIITLFKKYEEILT